MPTRRSLLLGLASLPVACGPSTPSRPEPGLHPLEDRIHGKRRTSVLFVPEGLEGPAPLLVGLHDAGQGPEAMHAAAGWAAVCTARGWLGLFPTYEKPGDGDDNAYLATVLPRAVAMGGGDRRRVYVVGHGTGGRRAYALGATHSGLLAGLAAVGSVVRFVGEAPGPQDPDGPALSVFHWHGSDDTVVPVAGGEVVGGDRKARTVVPLDEALAPWVAEFQGSEAAPADPLPAPLQVRRWAAGGHEVVRVVAPGAGHAWPEEANGPIASFFARCPPREVG